MRERDGIDINGHFQLIEINKITGERRMVYEDNNKIVLTGFQSFLSGVANIDQVPFGLSGLVLGNDIGNGTIDNPQSAGETMSPSDQSEVYVVQKGDINIDYPSPFKVRYTTVIDGDDLYRKTNNPRNMFTSASIRNNRGEIVAYKRFTGRTSSPLLAFNILWTISITPVGAIGTPQPIDPDIGGDLSVFNIIFYIMRTLDQTLTSDNPIGPEELSAGEGQYSTEFSIPRGNDATYAIALLDIGGGELVAIEWDGDTPTTPGVDLTYDQNSIRIESTHKPYIVRLTPTEGKVGNIGVCVGHACSDLWINA